MVQKLKHIISWLTRLLRNRSQTGVNVTVKGDVYHVDQKIVVIVKDHNNH